MYINIYIILKTLITSDITFPTRQPNVTRLRPSPGVLQGDWEMCRRNPI